MSFSGFRDAAASGKFSDEQKHDRVFMSSAGDCAYFVPRHVMY